MVKLFEETQINGMTLANRFVRSATWEGMANDDGSVTPRLIDCMVDLAKGGVGLIISGHAYVQRVGQASFLQLGAYSDDLLPGFTDMADAVHKHNGKIVLQIAHAGIFARTDLTKVPALAVSDMVNSSKTPHRVVSVSDIKQIVADFAEAAKRAKKAGFDGIQIHAAHGYLISQFLSPAFNSRTDEYGGDIINRARILIDVLKSVRSCVGPDYPVIVKFNVADFIENGLELKDSLELGKMLETEGIDAIELSGGVLTGGKLTPSRKGINSEEKEAYFLNEAKAFREKISVPIILVGGNRSYQKAEKIITESIVDYISMCRPLIREPDLINRWKSGNIEKSACISDNKCFRPALIGKGLYCVSDKKQE